ncbi:MAG: hypothetical protein LBM64_01325 [Deltaproteobacteria bacterium]|nr:hypothetical protein [Deltaproteobacteria bacterium]
MREQPLPLDDKRCLKVYQGLRRALRNEPLTKKRQATVLADATQLVQSSRIGDGVSAAMLLSALTSALLPARLHLSSPDERQLAGEVAALLVPAYERALAELSEAAHEAHWASNFSLALAEICLGSAYESAAFVEQNPVEKKRLLAKAFAWYARTGGACVSFSRFPGQGITAGGCLSGFQHGAGEAENLPGCGG